MDATRQKPELDGMSERRVEGLGHPAIAFAVP
jgi:hypothetical protein